MWHLVIWSKFISAWQRPKSLFCNFVLCVRFYFFLKQPRAKLENIIVASFADVSLQWETLVWYTLLHLKKSIEQDELGTNLLERKNYIKCESLTWKINEWESVCLCEWYGDSRSGGNTYMLSLKNSGSEGCPKKPSESRLMRTHDDHITCN